MQNLPSPDGNKNPDYNIEGNIFDCFSPKTDSAKNIRNEINRKVAKDKQTDRVVLNLDDSTASIPAIQAQLAKKPVSGLKEVLVVKNGTVNRIFP